MQIMPALETVFSSCLHLFRTYNGMSQFCPEDTWSALKPESLVQYVGISILVKVNNKLGNEALGRAKMQPGSVGVK